MTRTARLYIYSTILILVSGFLYTATHFLGVLDQAYFHEHEASLTTTEYVAYPDGSSGYNYSYDRTPYYFFYQLSGYVALIVPVIVLLVLSIYYFLEQIDKRNYLKTLSLPFLYGLVNIISFLLATDKSLGWEYELYLTLTIAWSIFMFMLVAIVNGAILFKRLR